MTQMTLNELLATVFDGALAVTQDENVAAQVASHVFVGVLERADPQAARELIDAFGERVLH